MRMNQKENQERGQTGQREYANYFYCALLYRLMLPSSLFIACRRIPYYVLSGYQLEKARIFYVSAVLHSQFIFLASRAPGCRLDTQTLKNHLSGHPNNSPQYNSHGSVYGHYAFFH